MKHWKADVAGLILICEYQTSMGKFAAMLRLCVSGKIGILAFLWLPRKFCYCGSPYVMCLFTLSNKQQEISSFVIRKVTEGWL
jgi:hypothetical protein